MVVVLPTSVSGNHSFLMINQSRILILDWLIFSFFFPSFHHRYLRLLIVTDQAFIQEEEEGEHDVSRTESPILTLNYERCKALVDLQSLMQYSQLLGGS